MVDSTRIPVNQPLLDGNESKYLQRCIFSGWISSDGPFVGEFEQLLAKRVRRNFGVAVSNGSVALDIALAALKIGPGDEVILPTFTIVSCAAAVVRAGATPRLVDCDPRTGNMIASEVASLVNERTKAIMVVHIYGLPAPMDSLLAIASRHGLFVIEDAAEMIGQTYNGEPCGSFGDISTFSFYANKHLTTGEGGMVLTNDERLADRCRSLRNLAFGPPETRFVHQELGWNFRLSNLQAAVGVAQLERLDEFVDKKRAMGRYYNSALQGLKILELPLAQTAEAENIYWVYAVVLSDEFPSEARQIMIQLDELGIGTRAFFWPMHKQPVFQKLGLFTNDAHPHAERLSTRGFYLPSGLALSEAQMERVVWAINKVLK